LFDHSQFRKYAFEEVPKDRDLYLMDEKWIHDYERAWIAYLEGPGDLDHVGYISYAAVRAIYEDSMEISWYPNIFDRFHEMRVSLPRSQFVTCIEIYDYDEKPHIFVKGEWLTRLHLKPYSAFALIDAIGMKQAIRTGQLTKEKLVALRHRIDDIATANPKIAFVSFADSLLLKSNWFVGQFDSEIKYSYEPEAIVRLLPKLQAAYMDVLGMKIYAIFTQGTNEYEDEELLHISTTKNHVCLNSLGLSFVQLMSIDEALRWAIRHGEHEPMDVYMDEDFYHSLRFRFEFDKNSYPSQPYISPMSSGGTSYFYHRLEAILANLREPGSEKTHA
jgi:hypothetical protein